MMPIKLERMKSLFILFTLLILKVTPSVCQKKCRTFECAYNEAKRLFNESKSVDRFGRALVNLEGAENLAGNDENNKREIRELRAKIIEAITEQNKKLTKANELAEKQKARAEIEAGNARIAAENADRLRRIVEEEKERYKLLAEIENKQKLEIKNYLDSLTHFNSRDSTLKQFSECVENAEYYFKAKNWDSSYIQFTKAIQISDQTPFLKVNKENVYARLQILYSIIKNRRQIDSVVNRGNNTLDFKRLSNIFFYLKRTPIEVYNEDLIQKSYYSTAYRIEESLLSKNKKSNEYLALNYLLIEMYHTLKDSIKCTEIFTKRVMAVRGYDESIDMVYNSNSVRPAYPYLMYELAIANDSNIRFRVKLGKLMSGFYLNMLGFSYEQMFIKNL